ncbi:MAG: hypothetical protein HOA17_07880 [Candidatus Melainabacteria bacterium]|nr:hypothetical protein [Candidatus Melainabacteria bacterium]
MVGKSINIALQQIVESNDKVFKEDQKKSADKLARKLEQLEHERSEANPAAAIDLRVQAFSLNKVADYAENLATHLEQNPNEKLEKKDLKEIKEALMESLGIPAEFIDQLSILVKAGPDALREAAGVYRGKAAELREQADLMTMEIEQIDTEISRLTNLKEAFSGTTVDSKRSIKDFVAEKLYNESLRDRSELVLKEALQSLEGVAEH